MVLAILSVDTQLFLAERPPIDAALAQIHAFQVIIVVQQLIKNIFDQQRFLIEGGEFLGVDQQISQFLSVDLCVQVIKNFSTGFQMLLHLASRSYINKLSFEAASELAVSNTRTESAFTNALICNKLIRMQLDRTAMMGATSTFEESILRKSLGNRPFSCKNFAFGKLFETATTFPFASKMVQLTSEESGCMVLSTFAKSRGVL
ncbi:hypothetical protein OGATHE_003366 [Ogataea polymorpha]|uniref:Uncharacterized protein n=1 Tax=Ogataea polymorpha TaxID=460523 RepID=A0A9P8T474_9ASCO|nr:hypothetical protein OGATHE_003366 [Ogataea polymorpha]